MLRSRRLLEKLSAIPQGALGYRVKIPLPSAGECWFAFDNSQTLQSVLEEIQSEDPVLVKTYTKHPNVNFVKAVNEGTCDIELNGKHYDIINTFESSRSSHQDVLKGVIESLSYLRPRNKGQLMEYVEMTLSRLGEQSLLYLDHLRNQLSEIEHEIDKINVVDRSIYWWARLRSNVWATGGLTFVLSQWAFFYYTIYYVEWLGWDLMEPITYSVGQGAFVFGLYYYIRTRQDHTYQNLLTRYESKQIEKMRFKSKLEVGRMKVLQEEKKRLLSSIEMIERKLNY